MADYDTFPKGTDFHGELPEDRSDAMEDGALWEYAHMYDVIKADETENENLSEHAGMLASDRQYGHILDVQGTRYYSDDERTVTFPKVVHVIKGILGADLATTDRPGLMRPGNGLAMRYTTPNHKETGRIDVQPATASTIGGVKVGDNIAVAEDGTISTDVNKAYVDKKVIGITCNAIAPNVVDEPPKIGNNSIAVGNAASAKGDNSVAVGNVAVCSKDNSVAIGSNADVLFEGSVSIGMSASCRAKNSVAIGVGADCTYPNCVSFGNFAVGGDNTRRLIFVSDPTNDSDAATKHYVDQKVASGGYTLPPATQESLGGVRPYGYGIAVESDGGLHTVAATNENVGVVKGSGSITIADDGTAKVNPAIFSDGLTATDAQVSVDTGFVGEHLAGDALYYDSTKGLNLKVGTGLEIQNDAVSVDTDALPLASASTRGTVKVGSGLAISEDGTLSATGGAVPAGVITTLFATVSGTGFTATKDSAFYEGYYVKGLSSAFFAVRASFSITTTAAFTAGTSIAVKLGKPDDVTTFAGLSGGPRMMLCTTAGIGNVTFYAGAPLTVIDIPVTADIASGTKIDVSIL